MTYIAYAGFFGFAFLLESKKLKKILLNIFLVVSMLNIIFLELVNHGMFRNVLIDNTVHTGVFEQFNHYGYYLMLVSMVANFLFIIENNKIKKVIYSLTYAVFLYYLIFNNTFGCYLAMFCSLVFFLGYSIFFLQVYLVNIAVLPNN